MSTKRKPSLAVWKFASCDGCQLTLLDCEDELLAVAEELEIAYFLEASSATVAGPMTCRWWRARSRRPTTSNASKRCAASRDSSSQSGPARPPVGSRPYETSATSRSCCESCTHTLVPLDAGDLDRDLGPCRGRFRAARLPHRPVSAPRGHLAPTSSGGAR